MARGLEPLGPIQPAFEAPTSTVLAPIDPKITQPLASVVWLRLVEVPLTVTVAPGTSFSLWSTTLTAIVVLDGTDTMLDCLTVLFTGGFFSNQLTIVVLLMNSAVPELVGLHVSLSGSSSPATSFSGADTYSAADSTVYVVPLSLIVFVSWPTCVSLVNSRPRRRS